MYNEALEFTLEEAAQTLSLKEWETHPYAKDRSKVGALHFMYPLESHITHLGKYQEALVALGRHIFIQQNVLQLYFLSKNRDSVDSVE